MPEKKKGKKSFEETHPAMSKKDVKEEIERQEKARAKFSMEAADVEKALTEYLEIKDPLIHNGKAVAWVRRPTMKQLKNVTPPEMAKYMENPKEVPEHVGKKYEKHLYEQMELLIAVPEHTAEEWAEIATPWLIRLFFEHLSDIVALVEGQAEGF